MRKSPQQERAKETVRVILEACAQILHESGLEGLTTKRVAERAGVSVGSVYQYFPNKEALVEAIVDQQVDQLLESARQMVRLAHDAPIEEVISVLARGLFVLQKQHALLPAVHRLSMTLPSSFVRRIQATEGLRDHVRRLLQRRAHEFRPMDPDLVSFVISFSMHGILMGLDQGIEPWLSSEEELMIELERMLAAYLLPSVTSGS